MPLPLVRTLVHRVEVASTSDLARELVTAEGSSIRCPLVVRADRQTRGRGRGANVWWSDAGALTFTLALDPSAHGLTRAHEPRLALAAAVALVDAVRPAVPATVPLGVRWPNDVEADGRKLAGILPERVETPEGVRLLVGIGVNVRTRLENAPPNVRRLAASLDEFADPSIPNRWGELDGLLFTFLDRFEPILRELAAEAPALAARWAELDLLKDQPVRVRRGSETLSGLGRGIDAEGALQVATERETLRLFGGQVLRGDS